MPGTQHTLSFPYSKANKHMRLSQVRSHQQKEERPLGQQPKTACYSQPQAPVSKILVLALQALISTGRSHESVILPAHAAKKVYVWSRTCIRKTQSDRGFAGKSVRRERSSSSPGMQANVLWRGKNVSVFTVCIVSRTGRHFWLYYVELKETFPTEDQCLCLSKVICSCDHFGKDSLEQIVC